MKKIIFFVIVFFAIQQISAQATITIANKNFPIAYDAVESQPVYPGGAGEFSKFIGANFHTPEVEGLNGVMKVSFVIDIDGSVTEVTVSNDLGHGAGEEAKRVVMMSPKWTPGEQGGKPVRVMYTFPITIRN